MQLREGRPEEAGIPPERIKPILELCEGWVEDGSTPALIVLVARQGVIFLHEAWGRLGPEPDSPLVVRDSLFGVASISKVVAATAVMLLVEEGKIGLHRPVQEYIPEFSAEGTEKILVRHLLTHTSGLRDEEVDELYERKGVGDLNWPTPEPNEHPSRHDWLQYCYRAHPWQPPDTEVVYIGFTYDLLGEIVRRVGGLSFNDFTRQRIFEPLGMKDAYFTTPAELRHRAVRPRPGTTFYWGEETDPLDEPSPAGGLWATALDMGILGQTFLNRGTYGGFRLLSPATVAAMTHNQVAGIGREEVHGVPVPPMGYGWFIVGEARFPQYPSLWSPGSYGHSGGSGAFLWVDPAYDLVGVFLFTKIREAIRPLDLFVDRIMAAIMDERSA